MIHQNPFDTQDREASPRIAYLLRMYPRFSQTFVVNEILELERQGLEVRIASLRLPNEGMFHESVSRVRAAADYLPDSLLGCLRRTCKIVGEGREAKTLAKQIRALGLSDCVELTGPLKQEQVRELIQEATCFVLPCVRAADGNIDALPTVLLEALAAGCPTISTRLSGIPEIIEHGRSGLLVTPGDEEELATAIRQVLSWRELQRHLAEQGVQRAAERFDIRRNVAVMHKWLAKAAQAEVIDWPSNASINRGPSVVHA